MSATLLVVYAVRRTHPLREAVRSHLYAWGNHSRLKVHYVNAAYGFPGFLVKRMPVDAVIFHNSFLGVRWNRSLLARFANRCGYLRELNCVKIAMPQDEFLNTDQLNDFINDFGITHVFSCADERDWGRIYDKVDRVRVQFRTVLTGYLDPSTVSRIESMRLRDAARNVDVGYRAWKAEYWLGKQGRLKVDIADAFARAARNKGLAFDISLDEKDVLPGDAWFDYLLRCRATIGAEGGASVLDHDGAVRQAVTRHLGNHPDASFEEVRSHCFPGRDGELALACISPRHLEACATRTLQFLVEGSYNGVLVPWRHYVPVKRDLSDVGQVLEVLGQPETVRRIVDCAYEEIVLSGKWSYSTFVREIEDSVLTPAIGKSGAREAAGTMAGRCLGLLDHINWLLNRIEARLYTLATGPKLIRAA